MFKLGAEHGARYSSTILAGSYVNTPFFFEVVTPKFGHPARARV